MTTGLQVDATLDLPAVLLVGGKGTRLRSVVSSAPKPMAAVGQQSFLELLVRQLRRQGIRRLVMCSGYLAEQIEEKFGDGSQWDVAISYSREQQPMGTAGAVMLAKESLAGAGDFLVLNGDSFLEVDFPRLFEFHRAKNAIVSMAIAPVENAGRYGTVQIATDGRVTGFVEKTGASGPGLINAGVYIFSARVFEHIPQGPSSLEKDIFPFVLDRGVYGLEQAGLFIDIGTPEDYARAQALCDQLCNAALRK
ncbi:MAG: nucleotidyltransferase family protein [Acidobacteria bacterium]|nr:nucleotidyltransferase family protein [Acidobacteriota bacterium]